MTKYVLRCHDDVITSLNASKHGGRLELSRLDYLWRMWRILGGLGPFLETNFTFCWWRNPESLLIILLSIVEHCIVFVVCLHVVFTHGWMNEVTIPVTLIIGTGNNFGHTIFITVCEMTVNSLDSTHIGYLCWSSRKILCRHSWWHSRYFGQRKCSHTILMTVWPGCFDNLFSIWIVSYSCHLRVLGARFILYST